MSGGNVDLQKARLHFEAQADSRGQRGLVVSSHSSDGRGGWNSMEVFGRLLSLNLGGRPLVLGEAGLVWRCAATPMPTFGHMWIRATFLFMAVPAESTELSWIHPMTTIGTPVRHPGGFGILLMLAITGRCFGIDVLAPLGATDVWIDPSNPDHIWLATGDGNGGDTYSIGVLETWDAGMSWAPLELAFEPSQGRRIHAISPHPTNPMTLLVSTDLGVFKTIDGGVSFDLTATGLARDAIWLNDTAVFAGIENQGVIKSVDGGETWSSRVLPEGEGLGRIQIAAGAMDTMGSRDTLYAIGGQFFQSSFHAFWRSVDGGETWDAQITRLTGPNLLGYTVTGADNGGQAFWDLCIEVDPEDANRVLIGGVNVWETDDGATWNCPIHWQGALDAKYAHADQHDIAFTDNGDVVLANDGGVFVWDGTAVEDRSQGLDITQGYALALNPLVQGQILLGTQDNGTNFLKPEVDARILDGDGFEGFFDADVEDRLYASAYYGLLFRSDDGGRTMTGIATYLQSSGPNEVGAWQTPFQMHPAVAGRIVAAKKSLHFSDDTVATTGPHGVAWAR